MNRLCESLTRQFFLVFYSSNSQTDSVNSNVESTLDNIDRDLHHINR